MCLPYHHIYICRANPEPPAKIFPSPHFFLHKYASGFQVGFCSLCRHNAGCGLRNNTVFGQHGEKKLHAAIFTSYYARGLLLTVFLSKSDSRLDGRKNIYRVHRALPNYINKMAPERKYAMNQLLWLSRLFFCFVFFVCFSKIRTVTHQPIILAVLQKLLHA